MVNNGFVSCNTSRSVVYNAVVSGLASAECTLWEWAWLAKNCARVTCRFKERELIFLVGPFSLLILELFDEAQYLLKDISDLLFITGSDH